MDTGIIQAQGQTITNPLPLSWLGRGDITPPPPTWAVIGLSNIYLQNLMAEIAYDQSRWDYRLIGVNNQVGRYQFTSTVLENYGLLAPGSTSSLGTACVFYEHCWASAGTPTSTNLVNRYNYNVQNLSDFLGNLAAQEHLAYQYISDLFQGLTKINAITSSDGPNVVAGMIYVAWYLGIGTNSTRISPGGGGAYAWRYSGVGDAANYFNSGRYAITVLSS